MHPRLEGDHSRLEELRPHFLRICDVAGVNPSHLVVFLDSTDHRGDASVSDHFRKPAGHLVCRGVTHQRVPSAVLPLMNDASCHFLIWLSKSLLEEELEQILLVFSHECRHFLHRTGMADANEVACSLMAIHQKEGNVTRYSNLDSPEELDCELFAHEVMRKILGPESLHSFIERRCVDPQGAAYYERLRYLAHEVKASNPALNADAVRPQRAG